MAAVAVEPAPAAIGAASASTHDVSINSGAVPSGPGSQTSVHDGIVSSLSATEAEAFDKLIALCTDGGLTDRPSGLGANETAAGINDQVTLLRFLRARKYDADGAFAQLKEAMTMRTNNDIVSVYDRTDVEEFTTTYKMYPHWTGRRDKRGLPVCFTDIENIDVATLIKYNNAAQPAKGSTAASIPTVNMLLVHDSMARFVLPLCSAVPDRPNPTVPVTSCLYLMDISALSMRQVWNGRRFIQDISKLLAINYPELLDKVFVIGAPGFFPRVWPMIKPWIDPVTAAKIQFLSPTELFPVLSEYIEKEDIPERYGGGHAFTHGMQPDLDEKVRSILSFSGGTSALPTGPLKWATDSEARKVVLACGTDNGTLRNEQVAVLQPSGNASLI